MISMFPDAWSVILSFLVLIVSFIAILFFAPRFNASFIRAMSLYLWHTLWCVAYLSYSIEFGSDAINYYEKALETDFSFAVGTDAVGFIADFLVSLGFSLPGIFLVFNLAGAIGLLAFDASLRKATSDSSLATRSLGLFVVLLPSVSFWSSALGKDSISFMAAALLLWGALELRRRVVIVVFSILAMLVVRPHMAGIMVMSLSIAMAADNNLLLSKRIFLFCAASACAAVLIPFAFSYAGLDDASNVEAISSYLEERQSASMSGSGAVNISEMNLPMKLFTYMYRPVLFEAGSILELAAAIDNLLLLYLSVVGTIALLFRKQSASNENRLFLWLYVLVSWLVLASVTANLGISLRQKWMFAPVLIFLFISLIGKNSKSALPK